MIVFTAFTASQPSFVSIVIVSVVLPVDADVALFSDSDVIAAELLLNAVSAAAICTSRATAVVGVLTSLLPELTLSAAQLVMTSLVLHASSDNAHDKRFTGVVIVVVTVVILTGFLAENACTTRFKARFMATLSGEF